MQRSPLNAGHSRPRRPRRASTRFTRPLGVAVALSLLPSVASATPGQAGRLSGIEAQGPATASVSALHHNPALLTALPGINVLSSMSAGAQFVHARPYEVDDAGLPTTTLGGKTSLTQPTFGYFVGASFTLDPFAIGIGAYSLGNTYRPNSAAPFRYHLANDPNFGCRLDAADQCPSPHFGGSAETRTDWTVAIAWNAFDRFRLGLSVHFPRMRVKLGRDEDTSQISDTDTLTCDGVPNATVNDPRCTRRLVYDGRSRLRWFGLANEGSRFDLALTVGLAVDVGKNSVIGLRYRTQPLLYRGTVETIGRARVCRPGEAAEVAVADGTSSCGNDSDLRASWEQTLPREVAVGYSTRLGARDAFHLDTNLYWIDFCPGGVSPTSCNGDDVAQLQIKGLDPRASALSETPIYRGRADRYGFEIYSGYDLQRSKTNDTKVSILWGGGFDSPATRPGALTVDRVDGWAVKASVGASLELEQRLGSLFLAPGYGLNLQVPTTVGPGGSTPLYLPGAVAQFAASGGDINSPSAGAVLSGRARPTNAGRYVAHSHSLLFSIRWSERSDYRSRAQ